MAPSFVWVHCSKINNSSKVKCNICDKEFVFNKSTSTMIKHLQCVHKIDLPVSKENQSHKKANSNENNSDIQSKKVNFN